MRGVGHELALGAYRLLQRREQLVEPGREPADLVAARWPVRWLRSPVSTIRSVVSVSRRSGATAVRETNAPRTAAAPIPPRQMKMSSQRRRARLLSISSSDPEIITVSLRELSVSWRRGTPALLTVL